MRIRSRIIFLSLAGLIAPALVGCSHVVVPTPGSARVVRSGAGRFGYVAEENGTMYVRDATADAKIATFQVSRGDMVYVDPVSNRIEVVGKDVEHKIQLDPAHLHELCFDRAQ